MSNIQYLFDFDGVLIDSVDECAVSSFNVVNGTLVDSLVDLPRNYLEHYRKNRCRGRDALDMVLLGYWCMEQPQREVAYLLSAEEFIALRGEAMDSAAELKRTFFEKRMELLAHGEYNWCELNQPYQPIWDRLASSVYGKQFLVITHKNREAVQSLCSHFGINISKERVYSGDKGLNKAEQLRRLQPLFPAESYVFIDDNIDNLLELQDEFHGSGNLRLCLASWGYVSPEDLQSAKLAGLAIIDQPYLCSRMLA